MENIIIIVLLLLIFYKYCSKHNSELFTNLQDYSPEWNPITIQYPDKCSNKVVNLTLKDFFIASAYRPYQKNNEISKQTLTNILEAGARCLYIDVFSSDPDDRYNNNAIPIVMNKTLKPESFLPFMDFCEICKRSAWQGTEYPLIFYLNLDDSVKDNIFVQFRIYYYLWKYFSNMLLGPEYSFSKIPIGDIPVRDTINKLVIITSRDVKYESLKEITNGIIGKDSDNYFEFDKSIVDAESVIERNNNNFTIVVPKELPGRSGISMMNSLPVVGYISKKTIGEPNLIPIPAVETMLDYKFSVIFINYQLESQETDNYLNFFKSRSFKLKFDPNNIICPKPEVVIPPLIEKRTFNLTPVLFLGNPDVK